MHISLFSQSLFALPLEEAIDATASIGYDAIELACCPPHFDLERARRDPQAVAKRITEAGLQVSALSGFNQFTDPQTLEEQLAAAETFIRLAPLFGTPIVKLTPGQPGSAQATDGHWRCLATALERLVPLARQVGVRLAFETHMRQLTDTLASSQRFLTLAPADVVGLTVDYSNMAFAHEDMTHVVADLLPRTFNVHLKNGYVAEDGSWVFGPLDMGWTDYHLVFPTLLGGGYHGSLTIECLGRSAQEQPIETARRDLTILRHFLAAGDGHVHP